MSGVVMPNEDELDFVITRDVDASIRKTVAPHLYVDPSDPYIDATSKMGHDFVGDQRYVWTKSGIAVNSGNSGFNNMPTFDINTAVDATTSANRESDITVSDLEMCHDYTVFVLVSLKSSALTAINTTSGKTFFVLSAWDGANSQISFHCYRTGSTRYWFLTPQSGVSGNELLVSWTTYPSVVPTADVPFVMAWSYKRSTTTSAFYFNDGTTPIATKSNHSAHYTGSTARWFIGNTVPANTNSGWCGSIAKVFIHDDTVSPISAADRIGIINDWKTAAGI
jgi:hypothetical protein